MKINYIVGLLITSASLLSYAEVSDEDFKALKNEVALLKSQLASSTTNKLAIPVLTELYYRTGTCNKLTNQPANSCANVIGSYCYKVADIKDDDNNNLAGFTFTAVKSTLDYVNRDGGVWMCDSSALTNPLIGQCTPIGKNTSTRKATTANTNIVEFTIPSATTGGVTNQVIVSAVKNQFGGINGTSMLQDFSICPVATTETTDLNP